MRAGLQAVAVAVAVADTEAGGLMTQLFREIRVRVAATAQMARRRPALPRESVAAVVVVDELVRARNQEARAQPAAARVAAQVVVVVVALEH